MSRTESNSAWRKFGEDDPYFGVLSQPRYRRGSLTEGALEEFFDSGAEYVDGLLTRLRTRLDAPQRFGDVLDFGCGVGRLAIPLAKYADQVTGVDISPAMLREAQHNQERVGAKNINFVETDAWLQDPTRRFDLVHTFIVLQHIPPGNGMRLIAQLVKQVAEGGFGVLHLTYTKDEPRLRYISWVKKRLPLAAGLINVARGRRFSTPVMQMNDYNLNHVMHLLQRSGVNEFQAEYTDHGGYLGLSVGFKKPAIASGSSVAA
ncbi:class I SAM-dependent methyltransferase [Botrimarina colliarenosi]|nr:class I SAM-dependent methyltransferase [Botrimarina colliarenosi]